ncbi:RNA polymerase sigma factor [Geitlerinema sp. CS-897]|nr:RNA polymerase sigma factor [Geitlerinema sp. CS-897]
MRSKSMSESQFVRKTSAYQLQNDPVLQNFWKHWQHDRSRLFYCCLKWMGNYNDAEDALSRATIKAWEKSQKHRGEIKNFKSWITQLTYNLCIDIHREHCRHTNRIINLEKISEEKDVNTTDNTPEIILEMNEKRFIIHRAIQNLPIRLRETFILHFYEELSYQKIAEAQAISYANVCKRISQSRKILSQELKEYFFEEDETDIDSPKTIAVTNAIVLRTSRSPPHLNYINTDCTV